MMIYVKKSICYVGGVHAYLTRSIQNGYIELVVISWVLEMNEMRNLQQQEKIYRRQYPCVFQELKNCLQYQWIFLKSMQQALFCCCGRWIACSDDERVSTSVCASSTIIYFYLFFAPIFIYFLCIGAPACLFDNDRSRKISYMFTGNYVYIQYVYVTADEYQKIHF